LLAAAPHAHTHEHIQTIDDLRPHLLDQIAAFFRHYNEMNGKAFKPLNRGGPKQARKLVDAGSAAFQAKRGTGHREAA